MVSGEELRSRPMWWMASDEGCRRGSMVKSLAEGIRSGVVGVAALCTGIGAATASKWWFDFCVVVRLMKSDKGSG